MFLRCCVCCISDSLSLDCIYIIYSHDLLLYVVDHTYNLVTFHPYHRHQRPVRGAAPVSSGDGIAILWRWRRPSQNRSASPIRVTMAGASAKCGSAVLALSCSCVCSGHSLLEPSAAEAFIPHRPNSAVQSWRSLAPVWVWAIRCSSRWPRKPLFHTSQMWQCRPGAFLLLCGAPAKCGSAVLALFCSCLSLGHPLLQPLAVGAFILHRPNVAM